MFTHESLWAAIDALAKRHGLSASGLAQKAGLSPTLFNPSKRVTSGRKRWPSTESLSAILTATNTSLAEFSKILEPQRPDTPPLPCLELAQVSSDQYFALDGQLQTDKWDSAYFISGPVHEHYILEITGKLCSPVYEDGDKIVVSTKDKPRRGDFVVAKLRSGDVQLKQLGREGSHKVELLPLSTEAPPVTYEKRDIVWLHKIVWASA